MAQARGKMAAYHQGVLKAEFVRWKKEKGVSEKRWMNIYYDPFVRSLHLAVGCDKLLRGSRAISPEMALRLSRSSWRALPTER